MSIIDKITDIVDTNLNICLYGDKTSSYWSILEHKTNLERKKIALGIFVFLTIYSIYGWGNNSLCNFVGFLYPVYASMLAIDSSTKYNRKKWQIYWTIYASFGLFEYFGHGLANSLKIYWLVKCFFLIWLMFSNQAISVVQQFLIRLIIGTNTKPRGFIINPPSENVELCVKKIDDKRIDLRLPSDSQGFVNVNCLDDGNYDIEAYCLLTKPLLLLHKFQIAIVKGVVNVQAVDLNATILHVTFRKNDRPFDGAEIHGRFMTMKKLCYDLNGRTDSKGVIQIPLPEGIIDDFMAKRNENEIKKHGRVTIAPPVNTPVNIPRQPKYIIIDVDSSNFSSSVNPIEENARVVVLGDISGSMGAGTKMDILRHSFREIFEKCQKNKWNVSLASWDTSVDWCTDTDKWIQSNQTNLVKSWIEKQNARGGNDMHNDVENCMKRHPDATDVYIMCDGDITPFYTSNIHDASIKVQNCKGSFQSIHWNDYRKKFSRTKFHFIALGKEAQCEPMEAMASIGDGIFHQAT